MALIDHIPFAKNAKELGEKIWERTKNFFADEGYTAVQSKNGKNIGVKTPTGNVFLPPIAIAEAKGLKDVLQWFKSMVGNPKEWIYKEPDDDAVKGKVDPKREALPDYYEDEILPATTRINISALKRWIQEVKWRDMSPIDLRIEYNRSKGTTSDAPLNSRQHAALLDSTAFKLSRKFWYVGRRSANETDQQWQEKTRHMRPAMGSYSPNEQWAGGFPYDETYEYTVGEIEGTMEKLKSGETIKW
tara:strand:+ start:1114 stop:1848 length:735 start_codon:yes stop_codon:yes gene_type:complete